jgi:hypothetical protein
MFEEDGWHKGLLAERHCHSRNSRYLRYAPMPRLHESLVGQAHRLPNRKSGRRRARPIMKRGRRFARPTMEHGRRPALSFWGERSSNELYALFPTPGFERRDNRARFVYAPA